MMNFGTPNPLAGGNNEELERKVTGKTIQETLKNMVFTIL